MTAQQWLDELPGRTRSLVLRLRQADRSTLDGEILAARAMLAFSFELFEEAATFEQQNEALKMANRALGTLGTLHKTKHAIDPQVELDPIEETDVTFKVVRIDEARTKRRKKAVAGGS